MKSLCEIMGTMKALEASYQSYLFLLLFLNPLLFGF